MATALFVASVLALATQPPPSPSQEAGVVNPVGRVAVVVEEPTTLRNGPRFDAAAQATLWRGDWLEVRGEGAGFLRVYDHRRERPGYVRPAQVRIYALDEATAPELRAVVRFLRDAAGSESLGIAYAALALKAAPAGQDPTEMLAAIGSLAERLARRGSGRRTNTKDAALAGELEVAANYGVKLTVVESGGTSPQVRVCYDGEAWAAVSRSATAAPVERAHAALFFAGDPCLPPAASPAEERERNDGRLSALAALDFAAERALAASLLGRVRLRRAEALAWRAFDEARRGNRDAAARAEAAAIRQLALSDRGLLAPEDVELYEQVAVKVAASRWAAESAPAEKPGRPTALSFEPRAPGETCVRARAQTPGLPQVAERCTYGVVWPSSLRWSTSGKVATLAVQPLATWTELWVVRQGADGKWTFETLTPATVDPDSAVGYVESAGFSPDGKRLLVVREARAAGRPIRRFQVLAAATMAVERWSPNADGLAAFKRWSAPTWRAGTLALR
jgi:hypothetical protein